MQAWGFGFREPSSSSDSGSNDDSSNDDSSGGHSTDTPLHALRETYLRLLPRPSFPPNDIGPAAGASAGRGGKRLYLGRPVRTHHPADWQYEWALRVLRMLRPTRSKLTALAMVASALYTWHLSAFP